VEHGEVKDAAAALTQLSDDRLAHVLEESRLERQRIQREAEESREPVARGQVSGIPDNRIKLRNQRGVRLEIQSISTLELLGRHRDYGNDATRNETQLGALKRYSKCASRACPLRYW